MEAVPRILLGAICPFKSVINRRTRESRFIISDISEIVCFQVNVIPKSSAFRPYKFIGINFGSVGQINQIVCRRVAYEIPT